MPGGLRVNPSVVVSISYEACLAYNIESGTLHRLNATAALVLELCNGVSTKDLLLEVLGPLLGDVGRDGCLAWIEQAMADGLIGDNDAFADRRAVTVQELAELASDLRYRDKVLAAYVCQRRAVELAPSESEYWHVLGELAHIIGHRNEARAAYETYHGFFPDDVEVAHVLNALRDEKPPQRASDEYIENLYARFAGFYEENVVGELQYKAPQVLMAAVTHVCGGKGGMSVLDLGCGTGLFGASVRPLARKLAGIDLSLAMIDKARSRGIYDRLEKGEITKWLSQNSGERYDLIAICDTLIYFGDLRQVICPAARLLMPGGVIAFTVEAGDEHPFRLTDSGRFSHQREHIAEVASEAALRVASLERQPLRSEYGRQVVGWVAVLQSP